MSNNIKPPRWVYWVVFIISTPVFALPWLLPSTPEEHKMLLWIYPLYVIGTAFLVIKCWTQRREMALILLILMVLSHLAVWYLRN